MTKRYRFYQWSIGSTTFSSLRKRLVEDGYSDEKGQGFHLSRSTRYEIQGRFVQRVIYTEDVISPDGSVASSERVGYTHTNFNIRPTNCGLLLIDPPRTASAFLHRLAYLAEYELSAEPVSLNLIKLKRALQKSIGQPRVTSVKITGAPLAENAVADISVSDQNDALERALSLFPQHRKHVGKLDMTFNVSRGLLRVSATRNGTISASDDSSVDALWEAVEVSGA